MQIKTGVDIIEVKRIKESIEEFEDIFLNRIYTQNEIDYCKNTKEAKYEHYAARFAVKEAALKAVSTLINDKYDISWKNIETVNDENGKPTVNFVALSKEIEKKINKIESIDVSISHTKEYAVATVVLLVS